MSLKAQVARGLKWQAIEIVGRQVLSLVVFTTLARLLDPSAFGLVGLVAVYLMFVAVFVDQGIGTALIQREQLDAEHLNAAFWFSVGFGVLLCLATMALAGLVARFFAQPLLAPLLRWGSLALVINASAAVHGAIFIRAMDFRRLAIRTFVGNLAGGAVGVAMAFGGYGVWALIGQQLVASLAGTCFIWAASTWRPTLAFSLTHLRQLMSVSVSVFATSLLWFVSSRLDQIVIGRFAGVAVLGQYVVGGKLVDMARLAVVQPVAAISLPALSRLQDNHERMRRSIYKGMELNALVSFAVFVGLAAVAHDLVPLAFGVKWSPAASICSLLSLYALTVVLQVFFHPALIASGGPGAYVLLNVYHVLGVAAACAVGIGYGVNALIIGLIINSLVIAVPALRFLSRRIGLSPAEYCRPCIVPLLASVVMIGVVWSVRSLLSAEVAAWVRLATQIVAGAVTYVAIIALLNPGSLVRILNMTFHAFRAVPSEVGNRWEYE